MVLSRRAAKVTTGHELSFGWIDYMGVHMQWFPPAAAYTPSRKVWR